MATPDTGIDWPAWVQAVGSVVALFLTGGLAVWEARQRRRDDAAGVGDRLDARVAVIAQASSLIRAYLERHTVENQQKDLGPRATYRSARFLIAAAREVSFSDMPSPQCVEALAIAQSALVTIDQRMETAGDVWLHQQVLEDINRRQKLLEGAIKTLREEVRRLRA